MKNRIIGILIVLILAFVNFNSNIVDMILSIIIDLGLLSSYILMTKKPIATVGLLLIRQMIIIVKDICLWQAFYEAVNTNGLMAVVLLGILIVQTNIINIEEKNIKDRIIAFIKYERGLFKVPNWALFCVLCILISTVNYITSIDAILTLGNNTSVKILGALVVLLPSLELISIATTSKISLMIIVLYDLVKIYVAISLYTLNSLTYSLLVSLILDIVVITYVIVKEIKNDKKTV